ncbi:hypothetical protein CA13_24610 [Planctomycetes bacterium CA13]|uniref:UPF0145 protein CA13_24610 n=1 Tax=Novipirellula herctigrandis TaxID=2527986 RepID=A0A5C5Z126_9BACT|nr:hypothetical protein CA13_24610 [Planctomycetes bacterium CA13]
MIVVTTEQVAGQPITESLGLVRGNTIRARHIGNDILAGLRGIVGGEIHEYAKLLGEAREQALDRMTKEAQQLGADAVVGVRFSTSVIMGGAAEMLAFGTAVKLADAATIDPVDLPNTNI